MTFYHLHFFSGKDYVIAHFNLCPDPNESNTGKDDITTSTLDPSVVHPDCGTPHTDGSYHAKLLQLNLPGVNQTNDFSVSTTKPSIMCLLFTTPDKYLQQARAVNDTWGKRCDVRRWFMTSDAKEFPSDVIPLPIPDGRGHLAEKTNFAFRYAYSNFHDKIDWFIKADDDTYIIMENLRAIVSLYDPNKAHYIGGKSGDILPQGYNGGGAGYTLSKGALQLIVQEGHRFPTSCRPRGDFEDLETGRCLAAFSVYPVETRDINFRLTFHPDHPYKIFGNLGSARNTYTYRKRGGPYPKVS